MSEKEPMVGRIVNPDPTIRLGSRDPGKMYDTLLAVEVAAKDGLVLLARPAGNVVVLSEKEYESLRAALSQANAAIAGMKAAIVHMAGYWCDSCLGTGITLDPETNCGYDCPDCPRDAAQSTDAKEKNNG